MYKFFTKMSNKCNSKNKIGGDIRPTDYEYALLSKHVYGSGLTKPEVGSEFTTDYRTWKIIQNLKTSCGYFGAIYRCDETKQFVIAHRGTNSPMDIYEDIRGILLNKYSAQKEQAFLLVDLVVQLIRNNWPDYKLSFTGHSLGAFLAELSVYYVTATLDFPIVHAVTFESPGSKQSIQMMQTITPKELSCGDIKRLDIVSYVSYPNLINACNEHTGTVYAINVELPTGFISSFPGFRLLNGHGIDGIVKWLRMAVVENNPKCTRFYMSNWPRGCQQLKMFFKYAIYGDGGFQIDPDLIQHNITPIPTLTSRRKSRSMEAEDLPDRRAKHDKALDEWYILQKKRIKLQFYGNYQVQYKLNSFNIMPLHHFSQPMQNFLKYFYDKLELIRKNNNVKGFLAVETMLKEMWNGFDMPEILSEVLLKFEIRKNQNEIEEIKCSKNTDLYDFRQKLSCWLQKTGFTVDELLNEIVIEENIVLRFRSRYDMPPQSRK